MTEQFLYDHVPHSMADADALLMYEEQKNEYLYNVWMKENAMQPQLNNMPAEPEAKKHY